MEQRIIELEMRYMQQEHTINELNGAVCRQDQAIERLERDLILMRRQFQQLAPSINRTPDEEEPPPHY